jgi:hypothetical protein
VKASIGLDDAPGDWRALSDQWEQRMEAIVNDALRSSGNADIAELREKDPMKYRDRVTKGGEELWHHGDDEEPPTD